MDIQEEFIWCTMVKIEFQTFWVILIRGFPSSLSIGKTKSQIGDGSYTEPSNETS
jgi:hypothetical protein